MSAPAVRVTGAARVGAPQVWDFRAHVALPPGRHVKSVVWTFDSQSTRRDIGLNAPGFVWVGYGDRVVTVVVTDDRGQVGSGGLDVHLVQPTPTPTPTPTPVPVPVPVPAAIDLHEVVDFDKGQNSKARGSADYGFYVKGDLVGKGSSQTVLRVRAHTSSKAGAVPKVKGNGGGLANPTNNLYVLRVDGDDRTVSGLTVEGTVQGHEYNGVRCDGNDGLTIKDIVVTDIPGHASGNPGETFYWNNQRTSGTCLIQNLSLIARSVKSAAGLALNSNTAHTTIEGLLDHGLSFSAGIATWQQRGDIDLHGFVHDSPTRALGAERLAATIHLYDPVTLQARTVKGTHDATYTWGDSEGGGYRGGEIVWDFSSDIALARWLTPKRPHLILLTNKQSAKQGIKKSARVLVAGKDRTGDLLRWAGA